MGNKIEKNNAIEENNINYFLTWSKEELDFVLKRDLQYEETNKYPGLRDLIVCYGYYRALAKGEDSIEVRYDISGRMFYFAYSGPGYTRLVARDRDFPFDETKIIIKNCEISGRGAAAFYGVADSILMRIQSGDYWLLENLTGEQIKQMEPRNNSIMSNYFMDLPGLTLKCLLKLDYNQLNAETLQNSHWKIRMVNIPFYRDTLRYWWAENGDFIWVTLDANQKVFAHGYGGFGWSRFVSDVTYFLAEKLDSANIRTSVLRAENLIKEFANNPKILERAYNALHLLIGAFGLPKFESII